MFLSINRSRSAPLTLELVLALRENSSELLKEFQSARKTGVCVRVCVIRVPRYTNSFLFDVSMRRYVCGTRVHASRTCLLGLPFPSHNGGKETEGKKMKKKRKKKGKDGEPKDSCREKGERSAKWSKCQRLIASVRCIHAVS